MTSTSPSQSRPTAPATKELSKLPSQPETRPKTQAKKEPQLHPKRISPQTKTLQIPQQKKVPRRSSKPIINWFQRKLAGSGRGKRIEGGAKAGDPGRSPTPLRVTNRIASSPLPSPGLHGGRQQSRLDALAAARRKTISLNGDDRSRNISRNTNDEDGTSVDSSSLARESTWSPASALEADEDASVRPIPPSAPPSPSPSRSSSSYLSDPRTFRSMAASTKPTTLLSIDLNANGMAHIAQVPVGPSTPLSRIPPHVRSSSTATNPGLVGSGASITFSALPPSPQSSRPSSYQNHGSVTSSNPSSQQTAPHNGSQISSVQAPLHTSHHPRNNPRPSSPPQDNASVLTLASSAFAVFGNRVGASQPGWSSTAPSAGDSLSHFGGSITFADAESTSQFVLGDDERLEERDVDASVRALRPRSSRRGSWESEASRWSARDQQTPGTPSLARELSLWTSNSVKTGGFSTENAETYERSEELTSTDTSGEPSPSETHASRTANAVLGPAVDDASVANGASSSVSQTSASSINVLLPPSKAEHPLGIVVEVPGTNGAGIAAEKPDQGAIMEVKEVEEGNVAGEQPVQTADGKSSGVSTLEQDLRHKMVLTPSS